jgi:hypothetical protein
VEDLIVEEERREEGGAGVASAIDLVRSRRGSINHREMKIYSPPRSEDESRSPHSTEVDRDRQSGWTL